jgi:hypothetical protein
MVLEMAQHSGKAQGVQSSNGRAPQAVGNNIQ